MDSIVADLLQEDVSTAGAPHVASTFPAREVAGKELEAAVRELYLLSNLLSVTREAAGVAAASSSTAYTNTLFETVPAVRDVHGGDYNAEVRHLCIVKKASVLEDVAEALSVLSDQLEERVSAHRDEISALNIVCRNGFSLLTATQSSELAASYQDGFTAAVKAEVNTTLVLKLSEVGLLSISANSAANAPGPRRRVLFSVPHVVCLPPTWRGTHRGKAGPGAGSVDVPSFITPRMLCPVLPNLDRTGVHLSLPLGHVDSRLLVCAAFAHDAWEAGLALPQPQPLLVRLVTGVQQDHMHSGMGTVSVGTGMAGADAMLRVCTRVATAVSAELLWDAITIDALTMRDALDERPSGSDPAHAASGQLRPGGTPDTVSVGKRKRTHLDAWDTADSAGLYTLLHVHVGSTEICVQGEARDIEGTHEAFGCMDRQERKHWRFKLWLRMQLAQEHVQGHGTSSPPPDSSSSIVRAVLEGESQSGEGPLSRALAALCTQAV